MQLPNQCLYSGSQHVKIPENVRKAKCILTGIIVSSVKFHLFYFLIFISVVSLLQS
jgi:hypothetical protein